MDSPKSEADRIRHAVPIQKAPAIDLFPDFKLATRARFASNYRLAVDGAACSTGMPGFTPAAIVIGVDANVAHCSMRPEPLSGWSLTAASH